MGSPALEVTATCSDLFLFPCFVPSERKRHITFFHLNFLCALQPRVCPRFSPGFVLGAVPGTDPGTSQDQPDKTIYVYVPFPCPSSNLFRFALLVFRNTLIWSDLFQFAPNSSDLFETKSDKKKPFCRPLWQVPDLRPHNKPMDVDKRQYLSNGMACTPLEMLLTGG